MRKSASISLTTLVLLLAVVVVASLLSPQNTERSALQSTKSTENARTGAQGSSSPSIAPSSRQKAPENGEKPSSPTKSRQTVATADPRNKAEAQTFTPKRMDILKRHLTHDESLITREQLADGTELIHFNGTQGHMSAATISSDGTIETQCHSSIEGLLDPPDLTAQAENRPTLSK